MKAFVFGPNNECIDKIHVEEPEALPETLARYAAGKPDLPPHAYVEAAGKVWTIIKREPLQLQEGRVYPGRSDDNGAANVEPSAGDLIRPAAVGSFLTGFLLTVSHGGWMMILAIIPFVILGIFHLAVHFACSGRSGPRPQSGWFFGSDALLFGGFLFFQDTGDNTSWLTITALIHGAGTEAAAPPAWMRDALWTNLVVFVPYAVVTGLLIRASSRASPED